MSDGHVHACRHMPAIMLIGVAVHVSAGTVHTHMFFVVKVASRLLKMLIGMVAHVSAGTVHVRMLSCGYGGQQAAKDAYWYGSVKCQSMLCMHMCSFGKVASTQPYMLSCNGSVR